MKYLAAVLLSLPLAVMAVGLLAAVLPVAWQSWLVLQILLTMLVWVLLSLTVALPANSRWLLLGLLLANGLCWALLQATSLYGGAA